MMGCCDTELLTDNYTNKKLFTIIKRIGENIENIFSKKNQSHTFFNNRIFSKKK